MTKSYDLAPPIAMSPGWPEGFASALRGREGLIIAAALECIAEEGLNNVSTHRIAKKAGVPQGSIHYHFASKEDLICRAAEYVCDFVVRAIEAIAVADMSGIEKIRTVVNLWRPVEIYPPLFVVLIALWAHANAVGGPIREVMERMFRRYRAVYQAIAEQGHREGSLSNQASQALPGILVAMPWGLGLQTAIEPGCVDWDRLIQAAIATFTTEHGGWESEWTTDKNMTVVDT